MRVPFADIRAQYMDTPERRVFDLRRDGLEEIPSLGWCSYLHARPDLPAHRHFGVIEIHFLDRGHQVFEVEGQQYHLYGGDLFTTQPGEPHSTGGWPVEPCVLYWLHLRAPKAGRSLLQLPVKDGAALLEALQSLPQRQFRGSPLVKTLLDRLLVLHDHPETALRRMRMRQAMIQLLLEVIDCSARHVATDRVPATREIARMIEASPNEEFPLKDLARRAGMSLSRFQMRFKEETGLPPRQFILRTKIEAACRRLLAGEESITKIAGDLGFPTSQYFATVFQRLMHMSPREYRKVGFPSGPSHRREDGQI